MRNGRLAIIAATCALLICVITQHTNAAEVIRGTLLVTPGDNHFLRLETENGNYVVASDSETRFFRGQIGMELRTAKLSDFAAGDWIVTQVNQYGRALTIKAFFGIIKGVISKSEPDKLTTSDGRIIRLSSDVQIINSDGKTLRITELKPGSSVTCRVNPTSGLAWTVLATPPAVQSTPKKDDTVANSSKPVDKDNSQVAQKPEIRSFTYSAPLPLKAGDMITVDMSGTSGGDAAFEIKRLIPRTKMEEISPGSYRAVVKVPGDKSVRDEPVVGYLTVSGTKAPVVQANRLVTVGEPQNNDTIAKNDSTVVIQATPVTAPIASNPTPNMANQTITTTAPTATQSQAGDKIEITTPSDGSEIRSSLVIKGKAEPDAKLQVEITYNNGLSGLLRLAGQVASQSVAVGKNGEFRMGPIPLEGPLATQGLQFTIKVYYPDRKDHATATVKVIGARA